VSAFNDTLWLPGALTWDGHEFLSAVRNDTVWKKTLGVIKEHGGGLPFDVLKTVAIKLLNVHLGLSGGE
jgi:hypothetical protein